MRQFTKRVNEVNEKAAAEAARKKTGASPSPEPTPPAAVYGDLDVCRILGVRRRVLVAARTKKSRGADWDVRGHRAGMTKAWILRTNPSAAAALADIEPLSEDSEVWTLTVQSQTKNRQILLVRTTDGKPEIAHVQDATMFHPGDQFDAQRRLTEHGLKLAWTRHINPEKY